ncbi:hypothetical protein ACEN2J_19385 [Pseudorhodobacter sp. W20_MBD10_FR17]|uniref:hypothetical protein n=1 Tax=Pseudorhodobacter sp. W20_MBD10_FR17 TaxID=3240266 RepID=UPI003F9CBB8B
MDFLKLLFPKSKSKIQKVELLVGSAKKGKAATKKKVVKENKFDAAADLLDFDEEGFFLEPEESFDFDIVGESFYQDQLQSIAGPKSDNGVNLECESVVYCDNENKHDKNAVTVSIKGLVVGHFAKEDAKEWRSMLAANKATEKNVRVKALIAGGWLRSKKSEVDEGHFGVKLDIPHYAD